MAAKIRLKRMGKRGFPFYRIVVADESFKRDGKVVENLGYFDPSKMSKTKIDKIKLEKWLAVGAQPTEAVRRLIDK